MQVGEQGWDRSAHAVEDMEQPLQSFGKERLRHPPESEQSRAQPPPASTPPKEGARFPETGAAEAPAVLGAGRSPLLKKVLTMKLKEMEEMAKHSRKTSTSEGSL